MCVCVCVCTGQNALVHFVVRGRHRDGFPFDAVAGLILDFQLSATVAPYILAVALVVVVVVLFKLGPPSLRRKLVFPIDVPPAIFPRQVPFGLFVSEKGFHVHALALDVLQGKHIWFDEFLQL